MMLHRHYDLGEYVIPGKVLVLYGPRRVGKTTLLRKYYDDYKKKKILLTGEDIEVQGVFSSRSLKLLTERVFGIDLLAIDEAQDIPDIGKNLKMLIDARPDLSIIVTGSSSFSLGEQVGEPLTGRKKTLTLYPLSMGELIHEYSHYDVKQYIDDYMLYGLYPDVIMSQSTREKQEYLSDLVSSYLFKDILALGSIKSAQPLVKLVKLLAFQLGDLVSYHELAQQVGLDSKTVEKYLDILEKGFIITSLGAYSNNPRKELSKKRKYYFWDLGIRNALIQQRSSIDVRNDKGALWENFVVMERIKYLHYQGMRTHLFFWRTYNGQEIDIIEDHSGKLAGYECKRKIPRTIKIPPQWSKLYPEASFTVIQRENIFEYVTGGM